MIANETIKATMTRKIIHVDEHEDLQVAHSIMSENRIRHLPVLASNNQLIGMLSDRDVLVNSKNSEHGGLVVAPIHVGEAMKRHPIACDEETKISEVAKLMLDYKVDCVPVVDRDQRLVGMVTSTDLIRLVRDCHGDILKGEVPALLKTSGYV